MTRLRSKEFQIIIKVYLVFLLIFLFSATQLYISIWCRKNEGSVFRGIYGYNFITYWIGLIPIIISFIFIYNDKIIKSVVAGIIGCVLIFLHFLYVIWRLSNPIWGCGLRWLGMGFYMGFLSWIVFLCINIGLGLYREENKGPPLKTVFGYIFIVIGFLITGYMSIIVIIIFFLYPFKIDHFFLYAHYYIYPILFGFVFIFGGLFLCEHKIKEKSYKIKITIASLFIGTSIISLINVIVIYLPYGFGIIELIIHFWVCFFSFIYLAKTIIKKPHYCYNCGTELIPPFDVCPNCKVIQKDNY